MRNAILILLAFAFLLSACSSGGSSPAVNAVEDYYRAMMDKNDEQYVTRTCAEWEEFALRRGFHSTKESMRPG